MNRSLKSLAALAALLLVNACTETGGRPMDTVDQVDLQRFMGDWYVIANIPTFVEKGAHNAIESYALNPDGTIATTFTFHKDAFDGPLKTYNPKGFVLDRETNAHWGMQFIWPFKGDFRIVWLAPDYSVTVIGRAKRDYVWIMARTPEIAPATYGEILTFLAGIGYDTDRIQRVPQQWETAG
ncbi:lipocalin family protein [Marichromatium gracile]|uniref:lipocalin family protein n=1 Tax=Marichromatium gracile TaxID=1048 RepID=UPI001F24418D|nr:lipocalin family protein [Marichromatium gracile]MCF1182565.1 lipocalin family protein [Marichromatium gracile]